MSGNIIGRWEVRGAMGADMPGMLDGEMPIKAQEVWEGIEDEYRLGLIPAGKKRGVALFGPMIRPDGIRITIILKVEYDEEDLHRLNLNSHGV